MARQLHKLTDAEVKAAKPGRLGDGGGLWLETTSTGSRSWLFMFKIDRQRTVMGLGGYPGISLARARQLASDARGLLTKGLNPLHEARKQAEPTFGEAVDLFLDDQRMATWGNKKHQGQWRTTLSDSYCKSIRSMKVSEIAVADILKVLKPVWSAKSETASRLRGRIERVLAFAEAQGWRPEGKNPAAWRGGLDAILPKPGKRTRGHHAAMAYADVPGFVAKLRGSDAMAARCLEFAILTAARSGEALNAEWSEIDIERAVWTIPAARMKAGREHRVPLSPRAIEILEGVTDEDRHGFVFPGERRNRPLSTSAMQRLVVRMNVAVTIHGFRSSFRDWCGDATSFPRELAEAALAHAVGDATERAYRRSSALAKRAKLMEAWSNFLDAPAKAKVLKFPAGQAAE
jgi:integrase